jgi:aminopeptidase-like protein
MGKSLRHRIMPAIIKTEATGSISAFTPNHALVMNFGKPVVAWGFDADKLEAWLTTLEEVIPTIAPAHRYAIEGIYFSLKSAYKRHQSEHNEVVTDAPTSSDLMAYLAAYAVAMGGKQ